MREAIELRANEVDEHDRMRQKCEGRSTAQLTGLAASRCHVAARFAFAIGRVSRSAEGDPGGQLR